MEIVQVVLLAVATFIFAIDQFSLTEVLYRPIIACTIIGAILGDLQAGLTVGGSVEIIAIGNMPVGGAQPPNFVIFSIASCVLVIVSDMEPQAAMGVSMVFALFGQYVVTLVFTVMSALMDKADEAAHNANPKGITAVLNTHMAVLGALFAVIAVACYYGGEALSGTLNSISTQFSWLMGGLSVAGGMLRFVGFGILMKIMLSNDMWGILLAGFACAAIFGASSVASATLIYVAFIGVAIALYDYNSSVKLKNTNVGGGMSDGI